MWQLYMQKSWLLHSKKDYSRKWETWWKLEQLFQQKQHGNNDLDRMQWRVWKINMQLSSANCNGMYSQAPLTLPNWTKLNGTSHFCSVWPHDHNKISSAQFGRSNVIAPLALRNVRLRLKTLTSTTQIPFQVNSTSTALWFYVPLDTK